MLSRIPLLKHKKLPMPLDLVTTQSQRQSRTFALSESLIKAGENREARHLHIQLILIYSKKEQNKKVAQPHQVGGAVRLTYLIKIYRHNYTKRNNYNK